MSESIPINGRLEKNNNNNNTTKLRKMTEVRPDPVAARVRSED